MKTSAILALLFLLVQRTNAQQSYNVTFIHDFKTIYGTFTTPDGGGKFPTIIINPGTGALDRDGTIEMVGDPFPCLYPYLLNDTVHMYKELSDALVDSGYAVLRYDKIEYTYTTTLGFITFHKLWLPVESAINYIKTRSDVDTNRIILLGHSEGSWIIPFIAKSRSDIKALISVAGGRTPLDSLIAYQIENIAQTCNGDTAAAHADANEILDYFNVIRTHAWDATTPDLWGVSASAWNDYVLATDSVSINYNINNLPTLFTGMELDINVPPAELVRLQNEVTITNDFWSLPGLIHYMIPYNDPHVSTMLTDTIIYWLRQHNFTSGIHGTTAYAGCPNVYPNPFTERFVLSIKNQAMKNLLVVVRNTMGQTIMQLEKTSVGSTYTNTIDLSNQPSGVYLLEVTIDGVKTVKKLVKESPF